MHSPKLIEFDNVTIQREAHVALREVSFQIDAGEHVAILGPNGSGKSTMIAAMTRDVYPRYPPPTSHLRIWGKEVWHLFELRALLGIVTNDLVERCTQPYTALETALSGFFGSIGIWPNHQVTPVMEEKAREALAFFDVADLADRKLNEMSSGEVRRAVFARALVHDPKALVLDEPTNSLDIRAQREVREAARKLASAGVIIVMVTHHLPDIIPEIQRVIAFKDGRVFGDGAKEDMLKEDKLSELFGTGVNLHHAGGYYHMW